MTSLTERHRQLAPFDAFEIAMVRHALARPGSVHPRHEAAIRYALSLARLAVIDGPRGEHVMVFGLLAELREQLQRVLAPAFGRGGEVDGNVLSRAVPEVVRLTRAARGRLVVHLGNRIPPATLERELTQRVLVLACGGGGGSGYTSLGAFALLESAGIRPSLIAGSSMGSVLGLFRARMPTFDVSQVPKIMGEMETRRVFRPFGAENRFSLPAAIRLELRESIGPYFEYDGVPLRLRDLPIPLLVTVTGIRKGGLPHPLSYYRSLARPALASEHPAPEQVRSVITRLVRTLAELVTAPEILKNVVLGANDQTRDIDVVDAVGYSSAVPGVLSYDLLRDAPGEAERFEAILEEFDLFRITDGGVADNVPARTAWRAVQRGIVGTRNAFILALDGFAPRLTTPLWLPIQRLAHQNVKRSIPYAHLYFPFRRSLSPMELLPRAQVVMRIVESAKQELAGELPFIQRMLEPLPGLAALQAA